MLPRSLHHFTSSPGETKSEEEKSQHNEIFFKNCNLKTLIQLYFYSWLFSNLTEHDSCSAGCLWVTSLVILQIQENTCIILGQRVLKPATDYVFLSCGWSEVFLGWLFNVQWKYGALISDTEHQINPPKPQAMPCKIMQHLQKSWPEVPKLFSNYRVIPAQGREGWRHKKWGFFSRGKSVTIDQHKPMCDMSPIPNTPQTRHPESLPPACLACPRWPYGLVGLY